MKPPKTASRRLWRPSIWVDKGTEEGWIEELRKLIPEKCLEYGQYLGKRYKDFDNILWVMGGNRDPRAVQEKII